MDAQDAQDFFWRRLACSPGHPQIRTRSSPESAFRAAASGPNYPVHPVHPCSIYSPSRLIFPVAGLGCAQRPDSQSASRAAASGPIHPVPWVAAQFPCDAAAGRSGSRRWARLCQCCAGGTPALPGGLPPMTPGYQGHHIADAFGRRWSLKQVHPYSCSFVSIGGSSSKMIGCFFLE